MDFDFGDILAGAAAVVVLVCLVLPLMLLIGFVGWSLVGWAYLGHCPTWSPRCS